MNQGQKQREDMRGQLDAIFYPTPQAYLHPPYQRDLAKEAAMLEERLLSRLDREGLQSGLPHFSRERVEALFPNYAAFCRQLYRPRYYRSMRDRIASEKTWHLNAASLIEAMRKLFGDPSWGTSEVADLMQQYNGLLEISTRVLEAYAPVEAVRGRVDIDEPGQTLTIPGDTPCRLAADEKVVVCLPAGGGRAEVECISVAEFNHLCALQVRVRAVIVRRVE